MRVFSNHKGYLPWGKAKLKGCERKGRPHMRGTEVKRNPTAKED